MAEKIINQIPGFEFGSVMRANKTDEVGSLLMAADMVSEVLNEWNVSVAMGRLSNRWRGRDIMSVPIIRA